MSKWVSLIPLITLTLTLTLACQAQAEDGRKLTYEQASGVLAGLVELDGPRRAIKDNGTVERDPKGYDIGMPTVVLIADNLARAKECASLFQVGQNATQKKWADSKTGKVGDENMNAYVTELADGSKGFCSQTFLPIKWEDLRPTVNHYPGTVVSSLLPILIMPDK